MGIRIGSTVVSCADLEVMTGCSDDAADQVTRLVGLGARRVREHDEPGDGYVVLLDPEGNEFCVCSVPEQVP